MQPGSRPPRQPVSLRAWFRVWVNIHAMAFALIWTNIKSLFGYGLSMVRSNETLLQAVDRGATRKVAKLVRSGASLSEPDADGRTALHLALERLEDALDEGDTNGEAERMELVRFVIDQQTDVDARDKNERAPIHMAVQLGLHEVARSLIDAGADLTLPCKGASTLRQATIRHDKQMVRLLLKAACSAAPAGGAERAFSAEFYVNLTKDGWSALALAARAGDVAIVEALLDAGADPAATNATGKTALDIAQLNKREAVVTLLTSRLGSARGAVPRRAEVMSR